MTAFPSYQASPGAGPQYTAAPPPILVAAADPAPQRRWTVLLRIILAVPHMFVLEFLSLAAAVIAFAGWWGALFTGRLPEFAVTFQSGYLRWYTRFNAYLCLLTDVWPPFSFDDDPSYPVRVAIPPAQRLNRAAVFFRGILSIPAWFMVLLVSQAITPIGFVAWVITLVTGSLPRSLHSAYLAVVRYQARVYGYAWLLLTPAYPGGLYGDGQATSAWADAPPAAQDPSAPGFGAAGPGFPGYGTAGSGFPGYGTPESVYGTPASPYGTQGPVFDTPHGAPGGWGTPGYAVPGYGAAGYGAPGYGYGYGYGAPAGYGRPVFQPATWLLRLTAGARRWVTAFIVIGALFLAGQVTLNAVTVANGLHGFRGLDSVRGRIDRDQLSTSYAALNAAMTAWQSATIACDHKLTCVTRQDVTAARGFNTFADQMIDPLVPRGAAADQDRLIADARTLSRDFARLSKATTGTGYEETFAAIGLQRHLDAFDSDYRALAGNLRSY